MSEKSALIIANNHNQWENVELLANELAAADYQIIASDTTAAFLAEKKVPTIGYEEFLGDVYVEHEAIERLQSDMARRRRVAGLLAECLGQEREDLEAAQWPVLDLAYINLTTALWIEYEDDKKDYLEHDENSKTLITATINRPRTERRPTLVVPQQIPPIIDAIKCGSDPLVSKEELATARRQALTALSIQNNSAAAQILYIPAAEFPSAEAPTQNLSKT